MDRDLRAFESGDDSLRPFEHTHKTPLSYNPKFGGKVQYNGALVNGKNRVEYLVLTKAAIVCTVPPSRRNKPTKGIKTMPEKKTFENNALGYVQFNIPMEKEALAGAVRMIGRLADEVAQDEADDPIKYPPGHRKEKETTQTPPPSAATQGGAGSSMPNEDENINTGEVEPSETPPPETGDVEPDPNAAELDNTGLPWDTRIHARTKSKTASGNWTKKRGVKDALVTTVEAELRAAPPVSMETPAAPPSTGGTPPPPNPGVPPNTGGDAPPDDPASDPKDDPYAPIINMRQLSLRITIEKLPKEVVEAATAKVGVATLPLLGAKPERIPEVAAHLGFV